MDKWEYKTVSCAAVYIKKLSNKRPYNYSAEEWERVRKEELETNHSYDPKLWESIPPDDKERPYNLAWSSENKYYTWPLPLFNSLGAEGWEIVATTPSWNPRGSDFDVLLKRKRQPAKH
jgi:hypothetical protein